MVDSQPPVQHLAQPQQLWQLAVRLPQAADRPIKEHLDAAFFRGAGQIHASQRIRQLIDAFLGEAEHHCRQQLPTNDARI